MPSNVVAPTEDGVNAIKLGSENVDDLIAQARACDEADRKLTIREALAHYKMSVFWAMILSTSLIMEGYDLVIVSYLRRKDMSGTTSS